jgi:undecaprenyl-phosphate 4-deoxy-4-formamido-L-arabinose transferase
MESQNARGTPAVSEPALHPLSGQVEVQHISIVVPVYQGERTLEALIAEIAPLTVEQPTPQGQRFRVTEVVLVHDGAVDNSDRVMETLAARFGFVRLVWLSRNFGQHPATLAGMATTTGNWIVTLDEDGQHNPAAICNLLDVALSEGADLVYARPVNEPPHGWLRNRLSGLAKWVFIRALGGADVGRFNSFRLIDGEVGRSLAAYCGNHVYLDVALGWVVARRAHCPVTVRTGSDRPSGYGFAKLARHFLRLVLTSGTRPLRLIALLGLFALVLAIGFSGWAIFRKLTAEMDVPGWASTVIVISFFSGCILFSLGVIAEYLGVTLSMSMGRPLYLVLSRRPRGKAVSR